MALGPRDTKQLVLLAGWDATALKNFELQENFPINRVVAEMNSAIGALNAEVTGDPLWSSVASYTDMPEAEYRIGASNGFERHTEYGRPDPKRADITGHMLPLLAYDRGLGWTWDFLRNARVEQVRADLADAIKDARDIIRVRILTRLLKRGDDSGEAAGLGSTGESPGFATAAASTGVDFTPPSYGGTAFTSDHEHYVAISGGVYTNAVFSDAKSELLEHGHMPPYEFWISATDETVVRALTDFYAVGEPLVAFGALQDRATFTADFINGAYYIGAIHDFRVRVVPGLPQYWGVGFKSYGANSERNPLRIRLPKGQSRLQVVAMQDPRNGSGAHPLQYMMLFTEFGVGVKDRTAGTARYVNNATWSDGTPT